MKINSQDSSLKTYRRLFPYLKPYLGQFILALFAMGVYGATDGAVPYILKRVLDDIFGARNETLLWQLVSIILIFAVLRGAFGFLERYLIASVGLRIVRDIRNDICRHLLRLSPEFFGKNSSGTLVSRMTNDTLQVKAALTDAAGTILRDGIRIIALLIAALYLDPVLGCIAFIGFPLALLPIIKFGKKVRNLSRIGQNNFGNLTSLLQEIILGSKVIQSFTNESSEQKRFEKENENLTNVFRKAEKYGALSGPSNEVIASLAIAGIILYGGFSVISGVRTQGEFIAFITALFLLYDPLKKIGRVNTIVQTGLAASERVFEIIDTKSEIEEINQPLELKTKTPHIVYQNVAFSYNNKDYALKNVNLKIKAGETIALVGMSGGGKSSLVNLLARFYDPNQGEILIDSENIKNYSLKSLRQTIAIVSQHTFLFNESIFYNIAYGKENASKEEVIAAAKAAYAHDFILRLPKGYDTNIGEQGFSLSGGERARIAIARALLKNAPILILDEATASLDTEAELLVQEAIDNLMKNRTVLVIAHRLSTIRQADRILVLKHGEIVEEGTHNQLLNFGHEYNKLYRLQFQQPIAVGE